MAGNGCAQIASDKVHCPTSFAGGIKVSLGTLADTLDAVKGVTLPVEAIGNAGDDLLKTGTSSDTLRGGEGNDTLEPSLASVPQVAGEQNTLFGGPGGDRFVLGGSLGADKVTGGDTPVPKPLPPGNSNGDGFGTDVADYSARPAGQGGVAVNLGPRGVTTSTGGSLASDGRGDGTEGDQIEQDVETVIGTVSPDRLAVDSCDTVDTDPRVEFVALRRDCHLPANLPRLDGGDGADTLTGDEINNTLLGGAGDDDLDGRRGFDTLDGGPGADELTGGPETATDADDNDTLNGGDGADELMGGGGRDVINGDRGADRVLGGPDDDDLHGGPDADQMHGEHGHDRLRGEAGNDTMRGTEGDDAVDGGEGDDSLNGDSGRDTVTGGPGRDTANGGADTDEVRLRDGIADRCFIFSAGGDVVDADLLDQAIMGSLCLPNLTPAIGSTVQFSPVDELPPARVRSRRLGLRGGRVTVRISCPRAWRGRRCAGRITVAGLRGKPVLARGRYRLRSGRTRTVRLRPAPGARRQLARRRIVRVTLVGRGRSRKGPSTVVTFVRPPKRR